MTTWAITAPAERAELGPEQTGEVSFTVTNSATVADEAVFDVVAGDNAAGTWFTIERPHERVEPGASVTFLTGVAIPPGTPAGTYWLQGRVYSASTAPEESSALSNRVTFEVKAAPVKPKPWWILAVVGLVVVVGAVVGFLLLRPGGTPEPEPTVAEQTPTPTDATVPDLTAAKSTLPQAQEELTARGLELGTVRYRHQPSEAGTVVVQSPSPNTRAPLKSKVDLIVAVNLATPTLQSPLNGSTVGLTESPTLRWNAVEYATSYQVDVRKESCYANDTCSWGPPALSKTDQTLFTPALSFNTGIATRRELTTTGTSSRLDPDDTIDPSTRFTIPPFLLSSDSGRVEWRITAIDAFGNLGQPSDFVIFTKKLK